MPYVSIILERRQTVLQPVTAKMQLIGNNRCQCFILSLLVRADTNTIKGIVISFNHHVSGNIQLLKCHHRFFTTPETSYSICATVGGRWHSAVNQRLAVISKKKQMSFSVLSLFGYKNFRHLLTGASLVQSYFG